MGVIRAEVVGGSSLGSTEETKLDTGRRLKARSDLNKQILRMIIFFFREGSQNK